MIEGKYLTRKKKKQKGDEATVVQKNIIVDGALYKLVKSRDVVIEELGTLRKANKKVHKESKSLNKVVEDINDYQSSNKRYNYITIYMEKKTNSKKVEVKKKEEKKPLIEKESIEREPRWGGPYIINTNPQPWQYIVSVVFLLIFFGAIVIVSNVKYT